MTPKPHPAGDLLPVSGYVICLNEVGVLGNCIESMARCSEIIIVDSGSTDGTIELVRSYVDAGWPIRLFEEPWRGFAGQKQYALDQCSQDWCISIDADERLDDDLQAALPDLLAAPADVAGWKLVNRRYLVGYGYIPKSLRGEKHLRLFRRGMGAYDLSKTVHESVVAAGRVLPAPVGSLLHFTAVPMDEQIRKINGYSDLKAKQLFDAGSPPRLWRLVFNPMLYFLRIYVQRGYWRCGFPGFIHARMLYEYSFLTESKLYEMHAIAKSGMVDDLGR